MSADRPFRVKKKKRRSSADGLSVLWLKLPLYFCNKKSHLLLHQTEPMVQLYSNSVMNEFDWGSEKSFASLFLSSFGGDFTCRKQRCTFTRERTRDSQAYALLHLSNESYGL